MDIFTPETLEILSQLSAVILILLILLGSLFVLWQILKLWSALAASIRSSQTKLEASQDKLLEVVEANTASHRVIEELFKEFRTRTAGSIQQLQDQIEELEKLIKERSITVNGGVIIFGSDKSVLYASQRALSILGGWSIDQLPGGGRRFKQDILTALNKVLPEDWFPSHRAADTGLVIENIPLQIYDYEASRYKWVMVSAFPCIGCQSGAQTQADWVTLIISDIGDLTAMP